MRDQFGERKFPTENKARGFGLQIHVRGIIPDQSALGHHQIRPGDSNRLPV